MPLPRTTTRNFDGQVKKRDRTRERILNAAQELLLEQGAPTITIKKVADRAGSVPATFYNYYPTTEALFDAVGTLVTEAFKAMGAAATADLDDPLSAMVVKLRQLFAVVTEEPRLPQLVFDAGLPVDRLLSGLRADFYADLDRAVREGVLPEQDRGVTSSIVVGAVLGLSLDLHRGRVGPAEIEEAVERLVRLLGAKAKARRRALGAKVEPVPYPGVPLSWLAVRAAMTSS